MLIYPGLAAAISVLKFSENRALCGKLTHIDSRLIPRHYVVREVWARERGSLETRTGDEAVPNMARLRLSVSPVQCGGHHQIRM